MQNNNLFALILIVSLSTIIMAEPIVDAAKIGDLEREIDSRLPSGYHWDKSELILSQVDETLKKLNGKARRSSLNVNMAAVETAIKNIEQEAVIIRHYTAMREFAINYPNIEYLLEEKLRLNGLAQVEDLPVNEKEISFLGPLFLSFTCRVVQFFFAWNLQP